MSDWLNALVENSQQGQSSILVTVVTTQGSTPREVGAKMVVSRSECVGTIGGGRLEFKSIELARQLLGQEPDKENTIHLMQRFSLGPSLGQCCGGVAEVLFEHISYPQPRWIKELLEFRAQDIPAVLVTVIGNKPDKFVVVDDDDRNAELSLHSDVVRMASQMVGSNRKFEHRLLKSTDRDTGIGGESVLFECIQPSALNIVLFGAGHVGRALIHVLGGLDCRILWIDSRQDVFPDAIPDNTSPVCSHAPQDVVDTVPAGSLFLVMTHSHPLDQMICERILKRNDFGYFGLIGSRSKRVKFEKRFRAQGIVEESYKKMSCPIGVDGISGKHPTEIAIAVAAEILKSHQAVSTQEKVKVTLVKTG